VSAGASALLFNLLYCIFLRREHERKKSAKRGDELFGDVCNAEERPWANKFYRILKTDNIVRSCFFDRYNHATDSLVFLAEPKQWLSSSNSSSIMKRVSTQNEMRGISLECISTGIGGGSSLIRNNLVGQILESDNIHPFPKYDDNDAYPKYNDKTDDDDDDYNNVDGKHLIFRPGFFYIEIVEKMFAALGASVAKMSNMTDGVYTSDRH